jgi:hypothetical protein
MPWQLDGSFLRVNPDFQGNTVWQQDQQSTIKIIAARHDFHDEDLAVGISKSLNTDGYNAMQANLNMGSFRINSMSPGTSGTDAVNKDQLDVVDAKADQNASDIAAIQTSDPNSIISAATFNALDLTLDRNIGDFVVPLRRFNDFKAGQIIRHIGKDLTPTANMTVDTQLANRFYLLNNLGNVAVLNFDRPNGDDSDLGPNYFTEGMIVIQNGTTPAALSLQADGVAVDPSKIVGAPSASSNVTYTLSYIIQRTAGDVYRESYIWSVQT